MKLNSMRQGRRQFHEPLATCDLMWGEFFCSPRCLMQMPDSPSLCRRMNMNPWRSPHLKKKKKIKSRPIPVNKTIRTAFHTQSPTFVYLYLRKRDFRNGFLMKEWANVTPIAGTLFKVWSGYCKDVFDTRETVAVRDERGSPVDLKQASNRRLG